VVDAPSTDSFSRTVQTILKRCIDLFVAGVGILLLSPLWIPLALTVGLTSRGPVLYRQRRLKQSGQVFTMYKFRTMVDGAETMLDQVFHLNKANGPLFKTPDDPRVTPVGRFLRTRFLDELPQLINVLKGDMSLVGPRPCLESELALHPTVLAFRFSVPQGLTGPWQTNGHHGITFDDQLRVERVYVESWTLGSDLRILGRTIPLVLRSTGF
jgi:lipopolysaccharide/colanic/teichoic acid biosynthesis glycosyltransferase